jgi:radical SAM superfamily enzyme YgiQ (UPF0313 family)
MPKRNVLLVQPQVNESEPHYAPLALLYLAAVLKDTYDIKIIDARIDKQWKITLEAEISEENNPLMVGVTSMTGAQIKYGLEISSFVKERRPNLPVVWGGVHPTSFPEQTLANGLIDFVIINFGEGPIQQLCQAFEFGDQDEISRIPGLGYKTPFGPMVNPNTTSLDGLGEIELPWNLVDVDAYIDNLSITKNERLIDVITSRGCPFRCGFCYVKSFYDRKWYGRDEGVAIAEIRRLRDNHGVTHFLIHDDLAAFGKKGEERLLRIFRGVNNGDTQKVFFSSNIRVDQFRRPYMEQLVEAGLWQIRAGVESGSDRVLKFMKKDIKVTDILNAVMMAKELNFSINFSFVLGWPGEIDDDRWETVDLCLKLRRLNPDCTVYPLWNYIPYPGTPFYDAALELGFNPPTSLEEWGEHYWSNTKIPWVQKDVLENMNFMSRIVFSKSNHTLRAIGSLFDSNVKSKVKFRRVLGILVSFWARFRLSKCVRILPYEHKYFLSLLEKISG